MSKFEPAPLGTYIDYLHRRLSAEIKPTHWYEYPFPQRYFLLATADFTTGGECGASARSILVPSGVHHLGGGLGHNNLYCFDEDAPVPFIIPIYGNPEFLALSGVVEFIAEAKQRDRAFWAEQEKAQRASDAVMLEGDLGRHLHPDWPQEET
jgi:hypothetical protein